MRSMQARSKVQQDVETETAVDGVVEAVDVVEVLVAVVLVVLAGRAILKQTTTTRHSICWIATLILVATSLMTTLP